MMRRPYQALAWVAPDNLPKPLIYHFRLDPSGRPLSIRREAGSYAMFSEAIGPSLAVSTFAPGGDRTDCTITYSARTIPVDQAPVEDLVSYMITPMTGPLPREALERIRPEGSTCQTSRPGPLTQIFPDFRKIAATPGVRDWTQLHYDLDARGRPVKVKVAYSTGNAALDAVSVKAMQGSRYASGPRIGCSFHYWKSPTSLPPPPSPDIQSLTPADAQCSGGITWMQPPRLSYAQPYRRNGVEGWAIVAFDVAPWGETGNIRTIAAEPAAEFGQQAEMMIRSARVQSGAQGKTGCMQKVRFEMRMPGQSGMPDSESDPYPPPPF